MVYYSKTLKLLHKLTPKGKKIYQQFLEDEGTKILYRAAHPIKWRIDAIIEWFKFFFS